MNCFCLVASVQTRPNQRLIFLSSEVSPGLQTLRCDWRVENNCQTSSFQSIASVNETLWLLQQIAQITWVILNGPHHYLSCRFKCFAHLFPLNISSSFKYSFNFLFKFFTSLFAVAIFFASLLGFAIINNYSSTPRKRLHKTCT